MAYRPPQGLELDTISSDSGFFTIKAYAKLSGVKLDRRTALGLGKRASTLSRELGIAIGTTLDEAFGKINSYSEEVLGKVFSELGFNTWRRP